MYTIKPLSPELATTFTEYLENLDFGEPHWSSCFVDSTIQTALLSNGVKELGQKIVLRQ